MALVALWTMRLRIKPALPWGLMGNLDLAPGSSTTALGKWKKASLPDGVQGHLPAKARRFNSRCGKAAYTRHWPMATRHLELPGEQSDISHIRSHLGEGARARHDCFAQSGTPAMACPATVHSFPGPPGPEEDPLSPYQLGCLNLTAGDAAGLQRAFLADATPVHSVPLAGVYKVVTGHPSQAYVPALHGRCTKP